MTAQKSGSLPTIAGIAAAIGWFAPFDVFYAAATGGSPLLRALLIAAVAVVGGLAADAAGLRLAGTNPRTTVMTGLLFAVLIAAWVLLLDCLLFRARLTTDYVAFLRTPVAFRLRYFLPRAFNENVIYRLFAFGLCAWLFRRIRGNAALPLPALLAMATVVQVINIGANVVLASGLPLTAAGLGYDGLRYIVPGVVWAWLFVRHDFATAEIASVGCHLFLQPGFSLLLDR